MVGQDREEANRLQQAKWELTSRIRDESNVPNAFHFSRWSLFVGYLVGSVLMLAAALIAARFAVAAERKSLESISRPLAAAD